MTDEIKKYTEFYGGKDNIMNLLLNELEKGTFSDCDEEFQKCCYYYITSLKKEVDELSDRIVKASRKIDKFKETYIICFDKPLWDFVKRLEKCLKSGDK